MQNIFRLISVLACFALGACASTERISLVANDQQQNLTRDGVEALASQKKHLVMLRPNSRMIKSNARPAFTIIVKNLGSSPVTLTEADVQAWVQNGNKAVSVPVLSHAQLVREEETKQAIQAVGVALAGAGRAMSAANAGYSTTTGSFSSYGYGRSAAHGTYQATTYNAYNAQLAQQAASAQTNAEIATMQAEGERNLQALNQTILKDHTVLPGEWYGGTIVMERPPRPDQEVAQYNLSIRFGGEVHEFQIRQAAPQ